MVAVHLNKSISKSLFPLLLFVLKKVIKAFPLFGKSQKCRNIPLKSSPNGLKRPFSVETTKLLIINKLCNSFPLLLCPQHCPPRPSLEKAGKHLRSDRLHFFCLVGQRWVVVLVKARVVLKRVRHTEFHAFQQWILFCGFLFLFACYS